MTYKNNADGTNTVGAIDGFFRMGESHSLNTMLIYSNTSSKDPTSMMQAKRLLQVMRNIITPITNGRSGGHNL
jgi:hypothetical protein